TPEQTRDYVRTRLRVAGARDLGLFSDEAITRIAEYSSGIPRLINTLCDHCLLIGYADQIRRIDRKIVEEAVAYVAQGEGRPRKSRRRVCTWRGRSAGWGGSAAGAVLLGSAAALMVAHREELRRILDLSAATLSGLAHAVSSFIRS